MFAVFCLLNYLLGAGHELSHHLAGYVSTGEFGRISFGLFASPATDGHPILASLAGPAFTFLVAWVGAGLLWRGEHQLLGYALVACSHSFMRLVAVVGRGGDESVSARALFGYLPRWPLVALEALLVLPPLVIAWRALSNRHKLWVYLGSVVGSFLPLILLKMIDDRWFAAFVQAPEGFHQPAWLGMPVVVLVSHCVALAVFAVFGARAFKNDSRSNA